MNSSLMILSCGNLPCISVMLAGMILVLSIILEYLSVAHCTENQGLSSIVLDTGNVYSIYIQQATLPQMTL